MYFPFTPPFPLPPSLPPALKAAVKSEPEEMETDQRCRGADQEKESTDPRGEAGQGGGGEEEEEEEEEAASEEGLEEGYDDEEEEEEEGNDEEDERGMEAVDEGESPSEPQDLSLVDFSRSYGCKSLFAEGAEPGDADDAPALGSSPCGGGGGGQSGSSSKLNCDICGLSCISINVLLVHKRSHTGKERTWRAHLCVAQHTPPLIGFCGCLFLRPFMHCKTLRYTDRDILTVIYCI